MMMSPEAIETAIRQAVAKHVNRDECYVFLFGSGATGQRQRASDYDIGLYQGKEIPLWTIGLINEELEESRIPVTVDVVDFATVSEEFKRLALPTAKIWNIPKSGLVLK
jgi:predicted nucleotidyltransferase